MKLVKYGYIFSRLMVTPLPQLHITILLYHIPHYHIPYYTILLFYHSALPRVMGFQ